MAGLVALSQACVDDQTDPAPLPEACDTEGAIESCFGGDAALVGTGACRSGSRTCASGQWSGCDGEVGPTTEVCGDETDNDCDGLADEECPCSGGTRDCYTGPPANRRVGVCTDGVQTCDSGTWSATCNGEVLPEAEVCGNAAEPIDESCNGIADEGCPCEVGMTRSCYAGQPATRNLGRCRDGVVSCVDGLWSEACTGEVLPGDEACDGFDNDCNGAPDDEASLAGEPVLPDSNVGNCSRLICDGKGGQTKEPDPTDVRDDGNNCTVDACDGETATNFAASNTTPCGKAGVCDGEGNCTGCNSPSDCGNDTPCAKWTCASGVCGQAFDLQGTLVGLDGPGDCQRSVCDGQGKIVSENDNTDVPNDPYQCTADTCELGNPVHTPLSAGATCTQGGGTMCDGAVNCVECLDFSDCGPHKACAACTNGGQCSYANSGKVCKTGVCDGKGTCGPISSSGTFQPSK